MNRFRAVPLVLTEDVAWVLYEGDEAVPSTIRHWCREKVRLGKKKLCDPEIVEALKRATQIEESMKLSTCSIGEGQS